MYKVQEYNIKSKCPVCGHSVMIDKIGNGDIWDKVTNTDFLQETK